MRKLIATLLLAMTLPAPAQTPRPNILFILVDDLGWGDLGCYGHAWHQTPHIDGLATEGVRFTQAYAPAPICSASRASILTGKSVARVGLEFVVKNEPGPQLIDPPQSLTAPPITAGLGLGETTIAEHLLGPGYRTAFFGKWHLHSHHRRYLGWSPTHGPRQQGFATAVEDFGSHPYGKAKLATLTRVGEFHPDGITKKAVAYVRQPHDRPFFLMVSHFYVHTPVKTSSEWLRKKYASVIPRSAPKRRERIEYAAFLETLDHHVGELLTAVEQAGLKKDTLVVFMSDNGGHPEYVANAPLRGSKWNLYEGGIRVPLLVRWPGCVQPNATRSTPVIGYDLFPTLAAAAGRPVPAGAAIDGVNLLPLLNHPRRRSDPEYDRSLYWHFPYYHPEGTKFGAAKKEIGVSDFAVSQTRPHSAIRRGDHKLIYFDEDGRSELYHLKKDRSEQNNLGASPTGQELEKDLLNHLDHVGARRAK